MCRPQQSQIADASKLLVVRLTCRPAVLTLSLASPTWLHHAGSPGPVSGWLLSPQRVRLQADRRGLLHPLRVLAGRNFVEKVGGFPCAGLGLGALGGGLKGVSSPGSARTPCSHTACPALPPGPFAVDGGEHLGKGIGAQGRRGCPAPGGAKAALSPARGQASRCAAAPPQPRGTHDPRTLLTLLAVLQPLAVQLQQDFPAGHRQLAGVPGAADHHALPR